MHALKTRFLTAVFLGLIGLAPSAHAFGTLNELGQHAEHERITRAALAELGPKTLAEIAGAKGTFGAVGAPDNPLRGLMFTSQAHCDNGDYLASVASSSGASSTYPQTQAKAEATLTGCRAWIVRYLDEAVRSAGPLAKPGRINTSLGCVFNGARGRAKCMVLDNLGVAFHAAQDFYSHSNWTDRPADGPLSLSNPPGGGHSGRAPWLDPRAVTPFPPGLLSGCFQAIPEAAFCGGRVRHGDLNKDTGPIEGAGAVGRGDTPRGAVNDNFQRAVAAAIEDTRDKWAYFEERVYATYGQKQGARIICVVRNDDYKSC